MRAEKKEDKKFKEKVKVEMPQVSDEAKAALLEAYEKCDLDALLKKLSGSSTKSGEDGKFTLEESQL